MHRCITVTDGKLDAPVGGQHASEAECRGFTGGAHLALRLLLQVIMTVQVLGVCHKPI